MKEKEKEERKEGRERERGGRGRRGIIKKGRERGRDTEWEKKGSRNKILESTNK